MSRTAWRQHPELKLVLIGNSGGGKTSLVMRYCRNQFTQSMTSTIGASFTKRTINVTENSTIELQIWDTAGQERFNALGPLYYRGAHIVVIVFDLSEKDSLESIQRWYKALLEANKDTKVVALVGNKSDLPRAISQEEGEDCASTINAMYYETSAKQDLGVKEVFEGVSRAAVEKNLVQDRRRSMLPVTHSPVDESQNGCC